MVGQTRATHLCAHAHSEGGNLSVAVEWLSDFGRVATIGLGPLPVIGASLTAVKIQRKRTVVSDVTNGAFGQSRTSASQPRGGLQFHCTLDQVDVYVCKRTDEFLIVP